jgi:hypothetical protein
MYENVIKILYSLAIQSSVARIRIRILTINFNYLGYVHEYLMMT